MKRSTWIAVLATAAVLVAAGQLPRIRWDAVARAGSALADRGAHAWPHRDRHVPAPAPAPVPAPHVAPVRPAPPRLLVSASRTQAPRARALPPLLALAGAAIAAALSAGGAIAWRLRTDRRGRVYRMARRGLPALRIAGRARVSQDAVRTLLTPGMGARR